MVVHTCDPRSLEAEAKELRDQLGYRVRGLVGRQGE